MCEPSAAGTAGIGNEAGTAGTGNGAGGTGPGGTGVGGIGRVARRYASLASDVLAAPARLGMVRWVAVDGPAGSGKTTFAARLAGALRGTGAAVAELHTDDLLDGWTDLVAFWPRLEHWVLDPLRRGESARYRCYDWHRGQFEEQWRELVVPDVLVVEGVSSARAQARPYLASAIFVTADPDLRLARGIARDGEALRPQWVTWMAAEERHFARDHTVAHVDAVVDGAPTLPHDPEREYVQLVRASAATS